MEDNIYGAGAVTGSIEDAQKQTIEIMNAGQKTVVTKDEVTADNKNDQEVKDDKEEVKGGDEEKGSKHETEDPNQEIKDGIEKIEKLKEEGFKAKGLDFEAIRSEFDTNGTLSEQTYKTLEEAGYPKGAVDAIISGIQATATQFVNTVYSHVGGEEQFKGIQEFVKAQGQKAIDNFNKVVNSKDIDLVLMTMDGIKAQMSLKYGTNTKNILGGTQTKSVKGFASKAEMVAAMSDPKYAKDPAYRAEVQSRVVSSKF